MAKILKLKQPLKRRRRKNDIPPPERQKREVESVRILPWAREELSYAATKRQEPRTTFESQILETAALVIANVRKQAEKTGIPDGAFAISLALNFTVKMEDQSIQVGCDERILPNSNQKELLKINKELGRFYNPFFASQIQQRYNPTLGCSINEAIVNGMDGAAWRVVRQLVRDARLHVKHKG